MRGLMMLTAACGLVLSAGISTAQAGEGRLSVSEIYDFIDETNRMTNSTDITDGRDFLASVIQTNAIFENKVIHHQVVPGYYNAYYGYGAGWAYRYPGLVDGYYRTSSYDAEGKWQFIEKFQTKKASIPGYRSEISVSNISMRPYDSAAVVDVRVKEYGLHYAPYTMGLTTAALHSDSACKMYLNEVNDRIFLARMDCNVSTALPL